MVKVMRLHKAHRKYRVDDVCHRQRCQQSDDQCYRQIEKEITYDTRPESQRHERHKRSSCACQHRQEHFTCGYFGCLRYRYFPVVKNTVRIFYHYYSIIHDNTQCQQEREQHDHVHSKSYGGENKEGYCAGERHRHGHKQCVCYTHEKHENYGNQYKAYDNGIDKVSKCRPGLFRLVTGYHYFQVFRQFCSLHFRHQVSDLVRCFYQVLALGFYHIQRDDVSAVQAGIAFLLLERISYLGYISQVNRFASLAFYNNISYLRCVFKLIFYTQYPFLGAHCHLARGGRYVFLGNSILHIAKGDPGCLHFIHVHVYLYLPVQRAHNVHALYLLHRLNIVLDAVGIFFQPVQVIVA